MAQPGPVLFCSTNYAPEHWVSPMRAHAPDLDIRLWPIAPEAYDDIAYAVVWRPERGVLKLLPHLRCVFSLGAGVDSILSDPDYPRHVPLSRMVDPTMTQAMSEYILLHVLYNHRRQRDLDQLQRLKKWRTLAPKRAQDIRVGILGLGVLGQDAAQRLKPIGYQIAGWSQTRKALSGIESFAGTSELTSFLQRTDILVCLLPLTQETRGILNAKAFALLPKGASVINCARGAHVVEQDLIQALDSGHLAGATLDVFDVEPLPTESPIWSHPKITVTPHGAALTDPHAIARHIIENIRLIEGGQAPTHLTGVSRGY